MSLAACRSQMPWSFAMIVLLRSVLRVDVRVERRGRLGRGRQAEDRVVLAHAAELHGGLLVLLQRQPVDDVALGSEHFAGIQPEFWFALLGGSFYQFTENQSLKEQVAAILDALPSLDAAAVRKSLIRSFNQKEIPEAFRENVAAGSRHF